MNDLSIAFLSFLADFGKLRRDVDALSGQVYRLKDEVNKAALAMMPLEDELSD